MSDCVGDDHDVQSEVGRHQGDRHADGFFEATEEYSSEQRQQQQSDCHLMAGEEGLEVRVLH
jgi:hypothetical protein